CRTEDLYDAWARYLPPPPSDFQKCATSATGATTAGQTASPDVALNGAVADVAATRPGSATAGEALTSTCSAVALVAHSQPSDVDETDRCSACGDLVDEVDPDDGSGWCATHWKERTG